MKRFLLAVSGGRDSVVLAHLFARLKLSFGIAHCNFQLRGAASDADATFVQRLAEEMNVVCHLTSFNTLQEAEVQSVSVQMAAR
ncbi:MAG: tRNA(Ile)-lysidine synthetase, partial [Phaeodactylibacter sp.]|nr:tRNA(Ile)-lysidine synthetase [Phaeodactylibacter sp.]